MEVWKKLGGTYQRFRVEKQQRPIGLQIVNLAALFRLRRPPKADRRDTKSTTDSKLKIRLWRNLPLTLPNE